MHNETRQCQNCKNEFLIEPDDFSFYEKIKVPPPTFCPDCRLQRRLVWMKGLDLFKRKCDLCGEMKISMYHPDAPYVVYCTKCWWGDGWNPHDYAMDYDPSRPFLEQWNELFRKTPVFGLSTDKITSDLSPYTNHVGDSKNCYLIYYSYLIEDSAYGFYLTKSKNLYDSSPVIDCENCYDSGNIFKDYNVIHCFNARHDVDCKFLFCSDNCTNCFGSANIRNESNSFFNEKLSKEEYAKKMSEIDLGSYRTYEFWKNKAHEHWKKYPPKPSYDDFSTNSTGSYFFESKNCKECYEVVGAEDSKYLMLIKLAPVKDSYDYTDWGGSAELIYECMTVGDQAREIKFSHDCGHGISNIEYSKLSTGSSYNFGCVSIKKTPYCILNKQYSKEEYFKLREKIIADMNANPYISVEGHTYRYGEFFPPEFSYNAYNDSFASRFFPLSKEQVVSKGLGWYEPEEKEYAITIPSENLPDHINETNDAILKEVIGCKTCKRGFKIIAQELQFLKQHNLPLPRQCPFCRIWKKVDRWVLNMKLHDRMCDNCSIEFKTHYSKDRAPHILCKSCYSKEYL